MDGHHGGDAQDREYAQTAGGQAAAAPKICIVCGQPKADGITVVTEFICSSCESEMVNTRVEEEKYAYFVRRMKQLWVKFHA